MEDRLTYILAAGGTGGHIFPALALAEELRNRGHRAVLITDARFAPYAKSVGNIEVRTIKTGGLAKGWRRIPARLAMIIGFFQARRLLRKLEAKAVAGFGGYPSFPTLMAAMSMKVPLLLHEQNSVLGRVNRHMARFANTLALTFESTSRVPLENSEKTITVGTPVRAAILSLRGMAYDFTAGKTFRLLVIGGSQGASAFAQVVPEAVALLPENMRQKFSIVQQCRPADLDNVRRRYGVLGIEAIVASFFNDIPDRLKHAHLVIGRAGASTLAELTIAGKPSILVPYPHAMDDHQTRNAETIAKASAGWVIAQDQCTPNWLADTLKRCLENPELLKEMAHRASGIGKPDAVMRLADLMERL